MLVVRLVVLYVFETIHLCLILKFLMHYLDLSLISPLTCFYVISCLVWGSIDPRCIFAFRF